MALLAPQPYNELAWRKRPDESWLDILSRHQALLAAAGPHILQARPDRRPLFSVYLDVAPDQSSIW